MKIREADAFVMDAIQVRRFDVGVAVAGEVCIALVVGENQDDVGTSLGERGGGQRGGGQKLENGTA